MSFKKFLKKHGLLSCLLALPFLGMAGDAISSQVKPPSLECVEQLGVKKCTDLMVERLKLSQELATYKWNHKFPIEVSDQETALVQHMMNASAGKIVDPVAIQRFFAAQIDASQVIMIEHFESWVAQDIHKHAYTPDPIVLQNKLDKIDEQLLTTLNGIHPLLCGHKKEELKIALSKILYEQGFSRDVIDAATRF